MSANAIQPRDTRGTRLTALVSDAEGRWIAGRAEQAGMSVSAYLRERALGADDAALRQVDALIGQIEANLDSAIAALAAANARMEGGR